MNTMVLFTMTVGADGTFSYSDGAIVCSNGVYTGPANWGSLLSQCKAAPLSITRIEMCIGAYNDPSWGNIKIPCDCLGGGGKRRSTAQTLLELGRALVLAERPECAVFRRFFW